MRILRVVGDYWPCVGGNERWNALHDQWLTETAGDDVQVVVLRAESLFDRPGYRELLKGYKFNGEFEVPDLPRVKVYQEVLPKATGASLALSYHKSIRPWVTGPFDVVITQIGHFHTCFCWRGRAVVYEPGDLPLCSYGRHMFCKRNSLMCSHCFRERGIQWWIRDQLKMTLYRRFDLIVGNELVENNLRRVNLHSRAYIFRHIVDVHKMRRALSTARHREQKAIVDNLAEKYQFVFMQYNRLVDFKNPRLLLDVAEQLPECAIVYAGDGTELISLEERVQYSPKLRGKVLFLGSVSPSSIGLIAEHVSAFVMTSKFSNHNFSLFETMGLGIGPVIAVDTGDFPQQFQEEELILKVLEDPAEIAIEIRRLLNDRPSCASMVKAAKRYVETYHSPNQMWAYRKRLLELVRKYQ